MQESVMQRMWDSAHLSGGNAAYVEELYELYLHDPNAVPEEWRTYFQKLPADGSTATDVSHSTIRDHFVLLAKNQRRAQPVSAGSVSSEHEKKQVEVLRLIQAYRMRGHQAAKLDPLGLWQRPAPVDLSINHYGLTHADHDLLGAVRAGTLDHFIQHRNQALAAFKAETLGARVFGAQVLFQALTGGHALEQVGLHVSGKLRTAAHAFQALLEPAALLGIDDVGEFGANGATICLLECIEDVA